MPVVRLDEELKDVPFVEVLKIDTEGADTWVVEGAKALLKDKKIGRVFFEENKARMKALSIEEGAAAELLKLIGYKVELLSGGADSNLQEYHASIR